MKMIRRASNMKKLFLAILPALCVLAGCSQSPKAADVIKEDTLAHAELFGDVEAAELPMKMPLARSQADYVEPRVGVQFHTYEESGTSYYAVRFVAAIASSDVDATWTRAVSREDSNQIKTMDDYEATVAYTSINDDSSIRYPYSLGNQYSRFVVYTMYNIPSDGGNYRIMAYLKLYDSTEGSTIAPVTSRAVVAAVNGSRVFAVDLDDADGKYFLEGRIGGQDDQIVYQDNSTLRNNYASFQNVDFTTSDQYGMFKLDTNSNTFQFFGKSVFFSKATDYVNAAANYGQYNTPKANGTYTLFVSKDAENPNFAFIIEDKEFEVYNMDSWTWDSTTIFAWVWDSNDVGCWKAAYGSGTTVKFKAEDDISGFLLVRCYEGTTQPDWSITSGNQLGRIYNKTGNITRNSSYSYEYRTWGNYPG